MITKLFSISQFVTLVVLCLFLVRSVSAQNTLSSSPSERQIAEKVNEYMNAAVKIDQFSGSVLVSRDGKPIVSKGYGMANYELNVPNTPQTVFRVAAITKQFTAMAVMLLQERGKLNTDEQICKYLENCPAHWQPVTIRHLLTDTSGIPNYTNSPSFWDKIPNQPLTSAEVVNLFRDRPLDFTPGEKVAYSNSDYYLLGLIIEKASRKPYAEFLRDNIFTPLGMKNSGYDDSLTLVPNRASGYNWTGKSFVNARYRNLTIFHSAGALYSTTEDLLLWDKALYTEKLISRKSLDEIFKPSALTLSDRAYANFSYKYGWYIGKRHDRQVAEHGGLINGFSANILRFPTERVTIIFLRNSRNNQYGVPEVVKMGEDLSAIVFGAPYNLPVRQS